MFSFLFSDPDTLRELYGAIEGVTLPPDIPVIINTLSDVLFMERINDISFEIGGKLVVLIEHQSTINPNMALRLLMYIARVYEKITGDKNLYSGKKLAIPRPEFIVLYNGAAPFPDEQVMKLSDSFEDPATLGIPGREAPELELVVKIYNINQGHNEQMARRCAKLNGYSAFIAKVREFERQTRDKTEAMKAAVRYCREHDILKEFLEANATEVMNMLLTEWNMEDALAVRYEEGLEEGMEKGLEEGMEKGLEEGIEKGHEEGRIAIAKNALAKGLSIDIISAITGLRDEDLKRLAAYQ